MAVPGRIACLFFLCVLALAVGCAAKQRATSPEQVLAEIGKSHWALSIDKTLAHENGQGYMTMLRDEYGREELDRRLTGLGFELDAEKRVLELYDSPGQLAESVRFTVKPAGDENAATPEPGARQAWLLLGDGGSRHLGGMVILRYNPDGDLLFFTSDNMLGVFVPRVK